MKILLSILLILSSFSFSAANVQLEKTMANNGATLVRVMNYTTVTLYCTVIYDNGYGYFDFYVPAKSPSRWYYEPVGYYEWRCQ